MANREVLRVYGMQTVAMYIRHTQETLSQWVALKPIFVVCVWDKGFEGGVRQRKPWWQKEVLDKALKATPEEAPQ